MKKLVAFQLMLRDYLLLALAFLLPFNRELVPPVIVVLFINWLVRPDWKDKIGAIQYPFLILLFVSYYLMHIIGLAYTSNMHFGLFDLQVKLSILAFPIMLLIDKKISKQTYSKIFWSFIIGNLLAVIACFVHAFYVYYTKHEVAFYYEKLSFMHHPTYFAMYIDFCITILLYWLIEEKEPFVQQQKKLVYVLILFFTFSVIMLSSKAGVITYMFVLLLSLAYYVYNTRNYKFVLIAVLSLTALFYLTYQFAIVKGYQRFKQSERDLEQADVTPIKKTTSKSTGVRILIWKASGDIIKNNLVFGVGTGDAKDALMNVYKKRGMTGALEHKLNAHDQYIQTFIALGLIGLLILLACLGVPGILCLKKRKYLYLLFLLILAFNFLPEAMLETQAGVVFYAFFNSILLPFAGLDKK